MAVEILLSTYNGAKYIREFLDSLCAQTLLDFTLVVRDDGSTDDTLNIIGSYEERFPGGIRFVTKPDRNLGPAQSFGALLNQSTSDYVLFADQDDVWLPKKVESLVDEVVRQEELYPGKPVLVHSDLEVVDKFMQTIDRSFWKYQGLDPSKVSLNSILVQNVVTGCATIVNHILVKKMEDMPVESVMHDWWAAMVAASFGTITIIPEQLIRYRQHGANSLGAKEYGLAYVIKRALSIFSESILEEFRDSIRNGQIQAKAFLDRFENDLSDEQKIILNGFANLNNMGWFQRRFFVLKHGLLKHGLGRNIGLLISI